MNRESVLQQLSDIKEDLLQRYQVTKIGIFGSVARNEVTETSDIDIVVEMQPNLLKRIALKNDLEKLLQRDVDVVRYRESMNPFLKSQIDRDVVYV